jgi:Resolvase, N terminal domain
VVKPLRCAIYTRKSTEHNLELAFNSLDAQREACEAYVKSQAHEGWQLLTDRYDDCGLSGASLERPALQQLLTEVREGRAGELAADIVGPEQHFQRTSATNSLRQRDVCSADVPELRVSRLGRRVWEGARRVGSYLSPQADASGERYACASAYFVAS